MRIVDPDRPSLPERHRREPLSVARHEMQPGRDGFHQVGVVGRRSVEDRTASDVHVRGLPLELQKREIKPAETVAVGHEPILPGIQSFGICRNKPFANTLCVIRVTHG